MNTAQEQRQQDILSEVTGSEPRQVLSDDVAAELIGIHLQDQAAEAEREENIREHGSPAPVQPLADAAAAAPPPPGPVMHPARPEVLRHVQEATTVAQRAEAQIQRARQLAAAGQKHQAAALMAQAAEAKSVAVNVLAAAQQVLPAIAAQEQQVSAAQRAQFLAGQDAIVRRELGDAWNPQTQAAIKDYLRSQGVSEHELAGLTDARTVLVAADAIGIPRGGKVRRDMSGLRQKSEQWRGRREPQGSVADEIASGRLRPGTLETQTELMVRGEKLSLAQQQQIAGRRAARLSAPPGVGQVARQQSEAQLLARISRVVR